MEKNYRNQAKLTVPVNLSQNHELW